jgi:hypothetical protein
MRRQITGFCGAIALVALALAGCAAGSAPCDVDRIAGDLAGDGGLDCGQLHIPLFPQSDWDGGLAEGVACALAAQDAGTPFRLHIGYALSGSTVPCADCTWVNVYVLSPAGQSFQLSQNTNVAPDGRNCGVSQSTCASFGTTYAFNGLDGGVPILSCQSPSGTTVVCGGC